MKRISFSILALSLILLSSCSNPTPGPDKTIAGAVMGATWGAGAGAIVGHQLTGTPTGEGLAVGAGLGLVGGAISGYSYDTIENSQVKHEKELASLKVQNMANSRELNRLQDRLDQNSSSAVSGGVHQVYFDADATSIRSGAIANLEVIANNLRTSSGQFKIIVSGHSDNSGSKEYNDRLASARASTVSSYLAARGISLSQIEVKSYGAQRPVASNNTDAGRQLNRRVDIHINS